MIQSALALALLLPSCTSKDGDGNTGGEEGSHTGLSADDTDRADDTAGADTDRDPPADSPIISFDGPAPTNLILISVDTLQMARVGRYSGDDTTPFLDGLLAEGVALDDHRSCSNWTFASVICAMGGRDPMEVGHVPTGTTEEPQPVPEGTAFLTSYLVDRGYSTALVTTNPFLGPNFNTVPGVQTIIETLNEDATTTFSAGLDALDGLQSGSEPWALMVHTIDPHMPYAPPDEYLTEVNELPEVDFDLSNNGQVQAMRDNWNRLPASERALLIQHMSLRYDASLRYWDDELAAFFSALEARGALDDALVVLWSDHGEQVYERDEETVGHGISLYDLENRALAALWAPGLAPAAWTGPTGHKDLLPTIWAAMGWPLEEEFTGLPAGTAEDDRALFGITYQGDITEQSVIQDGDKLIYHWQGFMQLYDLVADPNEIQDISESDPDRTAALWALLEPEVERLHDEFYPTGAVPTEP